jgi:hypothetical protein
MLPSSAACRVVGHLPHDRAPIARRTTQNIFLHERSACTSSSFCVRTRQRIALQASLEKQKRKFGNAWITTRTELLSMANTHALPSSHIIDDEEVPATRAARPIVRPLLRRFYDAVIESQMRRARLELNRNLGPDALARIAGNLTQER